MTATTILLGNLRLVCRSGIGSVPVTIKTDDFGEHHVLLNHVEFRSLVHVAAVVEAAKEWRERLRSRPHADRDVIVGLADRLVAALDTLTAGGEK